MSLKVSGLRASGLVLVLLFFLTGIANVPPSTAVNIGWTASGGSWSGSGTLFLPGGSHVGPAGTAGDCPGCRWDLHVVCDLDGARSCSNLFGCEPGRPYVLIALTNPGQGTVSVDPQCLNSDPITAEELGRMVADRVRQEAPKAQPKFQPSSSAITALPTNFRSGQQASISRSESIAGIPVDFSARARWRWTWGDGSSALATSQPGGAWPTMTVTHTYRRPGTKQVNLRTLWTAEYTVNGAGPFSVNGDPIEQSAALSVPVKEARSVLIGAQIG